MQEIKKTIPKPLKKLIQEQYELGKNYFDKYLADKKDNDKYLLEKKSTEKVHVRSLFSMLQNLYSIFVIDERKVSFIASNYEGENITKMYNKLAEYDYIHMNKSAFDFMKVYYGFIFGIGATRIAGWDKEENLPILESVNTMSLILDPDEIIKGSKRRFIGVKKKIPFETLKNDKSFFDLWQISSEQEKLKEIDVYYHYTRYEDEVYLTAWLGEAPEKLIKIEKFSKKSGLYNTFGFSLFIPWNVGNGQVGDLIELGSEYQIMMSQITNLMLIQAKKDVLGEDRFININLVDIEFLAKASTPGGRNIPIELEEGQVLSNAILQLPKEQPSHQAPQGLQMLENLKQEATGLSSIMQGIQSDQNMTKGEVQTLQANANMKFSLVMTFLIKSDKEFWTTWQAFYRQYFDGTKNIVLDYKHKTEYFEITRKDLGGEFTAGAVRIEARSEINKRKKEKHQNMLAIMPNVMPMMSEENQKGFTRDLMEVAGFEKEEATSYLPESPDEIQAKIDLEKLNSGLDPSEPQIGQKHEIFEKIFMQAIPSEKVAKAIAERRMLRIQEGQQAEQLPQEQDNFNNMQNISQAQTMSKVLNEDNGQNLFTNQDIQG
ncbi:hypothetical protein DLH72_05045 [Candidatus Gracilibacteria bacterium]|nr:MAG: hypothetical protein DLH72_05045 [Candidatus Gracilibacteria bacterium]